MPETPLNRNRPPEIWLLAVWVWVSTEFTSPRRNPDTVPLVPVVSVSFDVEKTEKFGRPELPITACVGVVISV